MEKYIKDSNFRNNLIKKTKGQKKPIASTIKIYFFIFILVIFAGSIIFPTGEDGKLQIPNWFYAFGYLFPLVVIMFFSFYNKIDRRKTFINSKKEEILNIGLFSKSFSEEKNIYTIYYAYGHIAKILPPPPSSYYDCRDIINAATSIVSDGISYDLTDKKSIRSIKVPNYNIYVPHKIGTELGATGYIEYVLRMHAGICWGNRDFDIAIACLEKATQLMVYSDMGWSEKDFYRIVDWLMELGYFENAEDWKRWIDKNVKTNQEVLDDALKQRINSCDDLDTDLVEVGDSNTCCAKCAKYRKRIFSLSGKDSRFPKFPEDFHTDCGLSVWPFIYGVSEPSFSCKDIIKYSNRPFLDRRTTEEKAAYEAWKSMIEKMALDEKEAKISKEFYYKLKELLPDDAPKSLSGFSRMRKLNSENYKKLVKKAETHGLIIPPITNLGK